ncbi:MAG: SGNH/GDSL hydrolase family protein [Pirellulales bacterium]
MQHDQPNRESRRDFFRQAVVGVGAASVAGGAAVSAAAADEPAASLIAPGDVVLFQGDSITDAGRSREDAGEPNRQTALGNGYAWLAASQLLVDRPDDELVIYNRGISGNKVFQLADRWQADCLDLKPDVLSILIGVNDIWHTIEGKYDGTVKIYATDYRALLERTRQALPDVKLVICEPFLLRCGAVDERFFPAFDEYRATSREMAESFDAVFVPFQAMFDRAVAYAPPKQWAGDGVHPSASGAALMAHNWLAAVGD